MLKPMLVSLLPGLTLTLSVSASELHRAVRSNDIEKVRELLTSELPTDVNQRIGTGITALHLAAVMNNVPIARLLLNHGARLDAVTDGGFTPLHWAVSRDATATTRFLLESGADHNAATPKGITPLHWAASKNAVNAVRMLIAVGADPKAKTDEGMTPLHWAVLSGSAEEASHILAEVIVAHQMADEARNPEPTQNMQAVSIEVTPPPPPPVPAPVVRRQSMYISPQSTKTERILVVDIGLGESLKFVWTDAVKLWVGRYEISNAQFRRFRPRHDSLFREDYTLNDPRQPAVRISWNDAKAFCEWLNKTYRDKIPPDCKFRLPHAEEWIKTAGAGDDRRYPWGDNWPPAYGNYGDLTAREHLNAWEGIEGYDDGIVTTAPVERTAPNEWGIYGLAGNVWEWCEDWYSEQREYKVRCGGSWFFDKEPHLRVRAIGFDRPDLKDDTVGFRVVISLGG